MKLLKLIKWLWSCYSYHFSGEDYRTWQCGEMFYVGRGNFKCCTRMRHHPGECNY